MAYAPLDRYNGQLVVQYKTRPWAEDLTYDVLNAPSGVSLTSVTKTQGVWARKGETVFFDGRFDSTADRANAGVLTLKLPPALEVNLDQHPIGSMVGGAEWFSSTSNTLVARVITATEIQFSKVGATSINSADFDNGQNVKFNLVFSNALWEGDEFEAYNSGLAGPDKPGVLDYYNEFTFNPDGDFTGGTVKVTRLNDLVTVSFDLLTHGTNASPTDAASIPSWARPSTDRRAVYNENANSVTCLVEVQADGDFILRYFTGPATTSSRVNSLIGGSISYNV